MAAVIAKLFSSLGLTFGSQRKNELKTRIDKVIVALDLLRDKVAELRYRFEQRSHELMEKIMSMIRRGEKDRAYVYADELAQIRNVLKVVVATENMVIRVIERLKTVREARELLEVMMMFGAALEEVSDYIRTQYPSLAMAYDEMTRKVRSLIVETSLDGVSEIDPVVVSASAVELMKQAMKEAEERVKRSFPVPPLKPPTVEKPAEKVMVASKVTAAAPAAVEAPKPNKRRLSPEEVEAKLLAYIREHGGFLDVNDFARRYGVEREDVVKALKRLEEKGVIVVG